MRCFNGEADLESELKLEEIRRSEFRHLPSRLQSLFACPDKNATLKLVAQRKLTGVIWEVEFQTAFAADMQILDSSRRLQDYWRTRYSDPQIEYVIELPARIVQSHYD